MSNGGYEKHIYEGVDKAMQLSGFYKDISTPVLKKINFPNLSGLSGITKANFPLFFKGSEIKIAGKGVLIDIYLIMYVIICFRCHLEIDEK